MAHLVPNYLLPGPHYFTELLDAEYDKCKVAVLDKLDSALDISFTTDLWTTKNSTTSHMALTGKQGCIHNTICHIWVGRDSDASLIAIWPEKPP